MLRFAKSQGTRTALVCVAATFIATSVMAQPTFDLTLDGPGSAEGSPGSVVGLSYDIVMTPGGELAGAGAQGWSLSLSAGGCAAITDITDQGTPAADVNDDPPGSRNTGFSVNELTTEAGEGSACVDRNGAVQAIVLSFTMPITLPDDEASVVGIISVDATLPAEEGTDEGVVEFVDGCQGSGQPVDNRVTHQGNTINPSLDSRTITCNAILPRNCPAGNPLELVFEGADLPGDPETAGSGQNPAVITVGRVAEGAMGSVDAQVNLVTTAVEGGVQGLSVSLSSEGDAAITNVTVLGTQAADVNDDPPGLRNTGFSVAELTTAAGEDSACVGRDGAVSALVLSFTMPIVLPEEGSSSVLIVTVTSTAAQPPANKDGTPGVVSGGIRFTDGCQGSGQPVNNVATVQGNTEQFDCAQVLRVDFESIVDERAAIIRGDPNDDGQVDIADGIWIVNELFREGPASSCLDVADANNDGIKDVSDATFIFAYRFQGGEPPAAPFPDCGRDGGDDGDDDDDEVCEVGTTECS